MVSTLHLTQAQLLKFELLDQGLVISRAALDALRELNGERSLSPHDYASTSGIILNLEDDVWVNAPIERYNPNFVSATPFVLGFDEGFFVEGAGLSSRATFWPQPEYHGSAMDFGPLNNYVVTHGDRARLSPVRSCSMTCTFCNIPYDDPLSVYALKPVAALVSAARVALGDPLQPARHMLISGGTPKPKDIPWMQELYATVLGAFPTTKVDLMMVPLPGLFDLPKLADLGLHELSINLELYNRDRARDYMRQKYNQGLDFYLDFIESATVALGQGRARSMLMVGLEPLEDTLAGVRAIAQRGGTPVLSPFRPDMATPLRDLKPPTADFMREAYERASDIVAEFGVILGPDCPPCSHNTLNFAAGADGRVAYAHDRPVMIGAGA
ncbi:radical SAM protein [Phycicoccus sp. Root563]|nr:radical SAM protein [Phycicoccus sp. Root563]